MHSPLQPRGSGTAQGSDTATIPGRLQRGRSGTGLRQPQLPSGIRRRLPGPTWLGTPAGTPLLAGRSLLMRLQLIKI